MAHRDADLQVGDRGALVLKNVTVTGIGRDHISIRTAGGGYMRISLGEAGTSFIRIAQSSGASSPAPDPRPAADLPLSGGRGGLFTAGSEDIRPVSPAYPVQPPPVADPALRGQDGGLEQSGPLTLVHREPEGGAS